MAGVTGPGMASSPDAIAMEFSRCWRYLGQLGMIAKDMVAMRARENTENITELDDIQKLTQLRRIIKLVDKTAQIELEEKEASFKKCNFFNRGFCSQGTSCRFVHPLEVCDQYEKSGICVTKKCQKRHLYTCKFYNSESGCSRGESCSYSHRSSKKDEQESKAGKCAVVQLGNNGLGPGQFGWLPGVRKPLVNETSNLQQGLKAQQGPCQQVEESVENESDIDSKEANGDRDMYDDLIEAIKKGNSEIEDKMLDKILEVFDTNDSGERVEELKDEKLDELLEEFGNCDNSLKANGGNKLKRGKVVTRKMGKKKISRGRGK